MRVYPGVQLIAHEIRAYILENFLPGDPPDSLRDDDLLLEGGIVDSGSVISVVAFLEQHFGIHVEDDELVIGNFATVRDIAMFVAAKRGRRMRLLLIDPVTTARSLAVEERRRLRQGIGYPGLGLLTVAALTPRDIEVRVVDESVEEIPSDWGPDLVGIAVQAPTAPYAYELAQRYRSDGVPVVLGGIHTSLNPDEAQAHADAIVIGEAEATWPTLVDDFRRGAMSRCYRADRLVDLDASPEPRRELLRAEDYRHPVGGAGQQGLSVRVRILLALRLRRNAHAAATCGAGCQ